MTKTTREQRTREGILFLALRDAGADSFLVNVIQCHHSSPIRKLRGVLALVNAGHQVRLAQMNMDVLLVDGQITTFESLEAK